MVNTPKETTIGQIVASDYRAATVFESFGIDFCCRGNRTIHEVCEKKGIKEIKLRNALTVATRVIRNQHKDFNTWPLDLLAAYIQQVHHKYVKEKLPKIEAILFKVCKVHGKKHPELFEILELFQKASIELSEHMEKEENILFPYVRKLVSLERDRNRLKPPHFGTIKNPIYMMKHEHDNEGERFRKIAGLSTNYHPPVDACTTYKLVFSMLKEFEADLHLHVHLENNILFPKVEELEQQLIASY